MKPAYPFVGGDPRHQRYEYAYSAYHGPAYFDAWRAARTAARSTSPFCDDADTDAGGTTVALLIDVARDLEAGDHDASEVLDSMVKRFEVTKRIHGTYGPDWRPVDTADHVAPSRYLAFAEAVEAGYRVSGALPYLNALLKVMDTLCAIVADLRHPDRQRLDRLIDAEEAHIAVLQATP